MKLYLIERIGLVDYDEYDGFVIRAPSPQAARRLAVEEDSVNEKYHPTWLDPRKSTCSVLKEEGEAEVVLSSFYAG